MRFTVALGGVLPLSVLLASAWTLPPGQQVHSSTAGGPWDATSPVPRRPAPPPVLLNEVHFDPIGMDGTGVGGEWVELYTAADVDLGGWSLTDNRGQAIGTLPALAVPAHSVVVLFFRADIPYPHDGDPSDRRAAIALGIPPGDHLDNRSGGVRLIGPQGRIRDSLYWGDGSAPGGAATGFFDLGFAGGTPMVEGDSLGRAADPLAHYSATTDDWDRHGGRNAAGPTPVARNGVEQTGMTGLKLWTQEGVNQIVNGFGTTVSPGWLSITSSWIENSVYSYQPDLYVVTSDHTFVIEVYGVPECFSGSVTATFQRNEDPASVGYSLTACGTLVAPSGMAFDIGHSESVSGYHTNTLRVVSTTDVTYTEAGVDYPFSVSGIGTASIVADGQVSTTDDRVVFDYGGAGQKSANGRTLSTRLSDGVWSSVLDVTRDAPIGPPPLALAGGQTLSGIESFAIEAVQTVNGNGEITSGVITRLDRFLDGQPVAGLQPGQTGSFGLLQSSGVPGRYPQTYVYALSLPLVTGSGPLQLDGSTVGSASIASGKLIHASTNTLAFNGATLEQQGWYVDPVLQNGFVRGPPRPPSYFIRPEGTLVPSKDPPPPPEPEPGGSEPPPAVDSGKTPGGFAVAAAICTNAGIGGGAALGGAAGFLGGATAGGVGALPGMWAGAKGGALVGGGVGFLVCGGLYWFDLW